MFRQKFDGEKGLEVILYITAKCTDMYTALKILYFADKEHLGKYGRLICGDYYVAMGNGPVPSHVYDMVKAVRRDGLSVKIPGLYEAFTVQENAIKPLRKPHIDYLSESDIECLDNAIKGYGKMSFSKLKSLSHDEAYKSADRNDSISVEAIIKTLPNGKQLLDYYKSIMCRNECARRPFPTCPKVAAH